MDEGITGLVLHVRWGMSAGNKLPDVLKSASVLTWPDDTGHEKTNKQTTFLNKPWKHYVLSKKIVWRNLQHQSEGVQCKIPKQVENWHLLHFLTFAYCFTCTYFICGISAEVLIIEVLVQVLFLEQKLLLGILRTSFLSLMSTYVK